MVNHWHSPPCWRKRKADSLLMKKYCILSLFTKNNRSKQLYFPQSCSSSARDTSVRDLTIYSKCSYRKSWQEWLCFSRGLSLSKNLASNKDCAEKAPSLINTHESSLNQQYEILHKQLCQQTVLV